jgi:uncharacterized integral membrane protein
MKKQLYVIAISLAMSVLIYIFSDKNSDYAQSFGVKIITFIALYILLNVYLLLNLSNTNLKYIDDRKNQPPEDYTMD